MTTMSAFKRFAGPRAPVATDEKQRAAFRLPNVLLGADHEHDREDQDEQGEEQTSSHCDFPGEGHGR